MNPFSSTSIDSITPMRCLKFVALAAVLCVGALIITPFPNYLPPDFDRGFLRQKQSFFYAYGYFIGFYAHIVSSPIALACGALQMSRGLRRRWPNFHRNLGKFYVVLTLSLVAPGGAIMSIRALGGWSSILCFALISLLAWGFTFAAWRAARAGRYVLHGQWMCRSYLMICSAILLRLIHFAIQPIGLEPILAYQLSAWLSWAAPLACYEVALRARPANRRRPQQAMHI